MFKNNDTNTSFGWYYGPPKSKKCKKRYEMTFIRFGDPKRLVKCYFFKVLLYIVH